MTFLAPGLENSVMPEVRFIASRAMMSVFVCPFACSLWSGQLAGCATQGLRGVGDFSQLACYRPCSGVPLKPLTMKEIEGDSP